LALSAWQSDLREFLPAAHPIQLRSGFIKSRGMDAEPAKNNSVPWKELVFQTATNKPWRNMASHSIAKKIDWPGSTMSR